MSRQHRIPCPGLRVGRLVLDATSSRYLSRVLRLRSGDELQLFDPEAGLVADATVVQSEPSRSVVEVLTVETLGHRTGAEVTLLQGLGKGDKLEEVIRAGTALGVARVVPLETERSVPRLGERSEGRLERWRAVALDAARQSGRGDLPAIERAQPLSAALATVSGLRLVLAPGAEQSLWEVVANWGPAEPLALLIGPEGGLSATELSLAVELGFLPVRMGRLVLRTELAAIVALGVLSARIG